MRQAKKVTTDMAFDPSKYMMKLKGKDYLPVAGRLVWFREEHPDWGVVTEAVVLEQDYSIFRASIFNAEGRLMATAHKKEDARGFPDHAEKAETGAIGRALALCGYGTQFTDELDEGTERIVDTPQQRRPYQPQSSTMYTQRQPAPPPPLPEDRQDDGTFGDDPEASNVRPAEVEDYSTLLRDFIAAGREAGVVPMESLSREQIQVICIEIANQIEPERRYTDKMPNAELLKKMRTYYRRRNGQANRKDRVGGED